MDIKIIECLGQYKGKNNWAIALKNSNDYDSLIDKTKEDKDITCKLEPMIKKNQKKCFKVVWLPPLFSKIDEVAKKLTCNIGKTISIKKVIDQDGLPMNIFNITIDYPENSNIDFSNLTGKKELYGEKMFITMYGDPIRCIYCSEFGHKKAECSKFRAICIDCGKRGHLKCTMATIVNGNSNEEEIDHEDEIITEEIETVNVDYTVNSSKLPATFPNAQEIIKAISSKIDDKSTPCIPKNQTENTDETTKKSTLNKEKLEAKNKKNQMKKEQRRIKKEEKKNSEINSSTPKPTEKPEEQLAKNKKRAASPPNENEKTKKQHNLSNSSIQDYTSDENNDNDQDKMDQRNSSR